MQHNAIESYNTQRCAIIMMQPGGKWEGISLQYGQRLEEQVNRFLAPFNTSPDGFERFHRCYSLLELTYESSALGEQVRSQ